MIRNKTNQNKSKQIETSWNKSKHINTNWIETVRNPSKRNEATIIGTSRNERSESKRIETIWNGRNQNQATRIDTKQRINTNRIETIRNESKRNRSTPPTRIGRPRHTCSYGIIREPYSWSCLGNKSIGHVHMPVVILGEAADSCIPAFTRMHIYTYIKCRREHLHFVIYTF